MSTLIYKLIQIDDEALLPQFFTVTLTLFFLMVRYRHVIEPAARSFMIQARGILGATRWTARIVLFTYL